MHHFWNVDVTGNYIRLACRTGKNTPILFSLAYCTIPYMWEDDMLLFDSNENYKI